MVSYNGCQGQQLGTDRQARMAGIVDIDVEADLVVDQFELDDPAMGGEVLHITYREYCLLLQYGHDVFEVTVACLADKNDLTGMVLVKGCESLDFEGAFLY